MKEQHRLNSSRGIKAHEGSSYFWKIDAGYSEQYIKAKQAIIEKSKKLREIKGNGKQNSSVMFQFNKPKSGFFQLKGCKLSKIIESNCKENLKQNEKSHEYLSYFMKRYTQRKVKKLQKETGQRILPLVNLLIPITKRQNCESKLVDNSVHRENSQRVVKTIEGKLRTEPIETKRSNKSCQFLQKRTNTSSFELRKRSVVNK